MSKVYEALQHAHAERELVLRIESGHSLEIENQHAVDGYELLPCRMEREMMRLHQSIASPFHVSRMNVFQFIGSQKGEGTSTILREFGNVISRKLNKSVLLVDVDSSQMDQHRAFGIRPGISLQQIMAEGGSLDKAFVQVKNSRVSLCRLSGIVGANLQPGCSPIDGETWNQLRKQFAFILIDSPPVSISDGALALCSSVDGVILVVEAEKTRAQVVLNMKERVIQSGGNILGLVFNKERHYIPEWIYKRL